MIFITLKNLISIFSNDTKIRIENYNDTLFEGPISKSKEIDKSNLEVVWCEIKDNILIIQIEQ